MPTKIKNHGKCKEWEQRRRDRLNDAFNNLAQLLPHHDPAKIPAKIDILEKSMEFVKELRLSNSRLLSNRAESDEKCKLIKELQDEVNKLILRVKQLTILLKKANITIPTGPEIKSLGSKKPKWSGKLKPDNVENCATHTNNESTKVGTLPSEKSSTEKGSLSTPNNLPIISTSSTSVPAPGPNLTPVSSTSHGPPIIIPLKETNSIKITTSSVAPVTATPTIMTAAISTNSGLTFSSPQKGGTFLSVTSSSSSPTKFVSTEPIFTTTAGTQIQLPLQTFFLAPCPISGATTAYPTTSHSQILTRIALPTTLLQKPLEGMSFQKLPIKSVLKPIPKIIKRRKRTKKPVLPATTKVETIDIADAETVEPVKESGMPSGDKNKDDRVIVMEESCSVPPPTLINKIPEIEGGKAPEVENDKRAASNRGESENGSADSIREMITEPTTNDMRDSVEQTAAELRGNVGKENQNEHERSQTNTVSVMDSGTEASDNIPVLRIIETGADLEGNGKDRNEILYNVTDSAQRTDKHEGVQISTTASQRPEESAANRQTLTDTELLVEPPKGNVDVRKNVSIINEPLKVTTSSTVQVEMNIEASSTSEILALEETGNAKDAIRTPTSKINIPQQDVLAKASVPSSVPSNLIEGVAEKATQPELSQQQILKKGHEQVPSKRTAETLPCAKEKRLEPINMEVENDITPVDTPVPRSQTDMMNVTVSIAKDIHHSRVLKPFQPEEVKDKGIPITTKMHAVAHKEKEASQRPIVESLSILPTLPPEPVVTASVTLFHKPKDISSTSSSHSKGLSSLLHHELMDTSEAVTTTDKISECIARSIDLIDANDSELMELGDHWEDTGGSPKSPISPTQMFLNMFPLLPRENTAADHHPQQPQPSTSQPLHHSTVAVSTSSHKISSIAPFTASSSSRSSFFIDAMLPEDHSTNTTSSIVDEIGIVSSSHVAPPCLAMTPPQYASTSGQQISSPFSLSSNYYWTPATASCSLDNAFDYRPAPAIITPQRITTTSGASTTNTFTSPSSTKSFSTFPTVTTASAHIFSSTLSTPSSSNTITTTASSTSTSKGKSGKSSKSTAIPKQFSVSDPNFPLLSTKVSKPATSTVATTSVTWTLSAPSQSVTCYSHHHPTSGSLAQPQPLSQNSSTNAQIHFPHHGAANAHAAPTSTCSLLDSLNPMDASFFRPLINALDAHDFRTLDFASGNSLPPPPPPLPSLMPPAPAKSLFTSQIAASDANPQPTINVSYHTPAISSHESHVPVLQTSLIHHHPSTSIFGSAAQQQPTTGTGTLLSNSGSPKKQQHSNPNTSPAQATSSKGKVPPPLQTPAKHRATTSNTDKASKESKTSGRQKAESSKQSRSGKSSRTQPYYIPTAVTTATAPQSGRQDQQNVPGVSKLPTTLQTNTQFLIGQSNQSTTLASCSPQKSHVPQPKPYDFQPFHVPSDSSFHMPHSNFTPPTSANLVRQPPTQHPPPPKQSSSRSSSSETKSQKIREEKAKASSSSAATKSNSKHQPSSSTAVTTPVIQTTNHSAALLSQQPTRMPQTSIAQTQPSRTPQTSTTQPTRAPQIVTAQPLPKPVTQISPKSLQNPEQVESNINMSHAFQFHAEPFLFPDFSGGNGSRQFGTHSHTQHTHYNPDIFHENHPQQHEQAASSSYSQRSHPYYLPEMPSFESFAMPIQQQQHQPVQVTHQPSHQPQPIQVTHQPSHQPPSATNSRQSGNGNQNQNNTKYNYTPNIQITNSQSHLSVPTSESAGHHNLQQQTSHSQSSALPQPSSSLSHQHQHQSIVHHENPTYIQQQQQRGHLAQVLSVPQQSQNQINIAQTHRHTQQESSRQQQQPQASTQHRNQPPTSVATSLPLQSSATSVSTAKPKPSQQPMLTQTFNQVPQPQPNQSSQSTHHLHQQHPRHLTQHQPQLAIPSQQQPQSSRPNARTVNWMTDTAYRTTSSSSNIGAAKQRHGESGPGPTSNPFSVSKLVGNSSGGQSKNQQLVNTEQHQQQHHQVTSAPVQQRPSNVPRGKAPTAATSSSVVGLSTTNMNSQNQSNYCAEALIRKNPNPPTGDWNDFSFGTNPSFQGYSTHQPHHHHHHHSSNQNPSSTDNSNYGQYQYPPNTSAHSSVTSHFTHFDYSQSQQFPVPHNHQSNNQIQQQGNYHSAPAQQQHQIPQNPHHVHHSQPHSSHHQTHQIQYPNQGHHHHHHPGHGSSSTSSVSNFNLSTIFPEINDKRSGSGGASNSNVGVGHSGNSQNSGIPSGRSGGQGSSCGYQPPGFGHQAGSGRHQ